MILSATCAINNFEEYVHLIPGLPAKLVKKKNNEKMLLFQ